jgi:hypothetical protein
MNLQFHAPRLTWTAHRLLLGASFVAGMAAFVWGYIQNSSAAPFCSQAPFRPSSEAAFLAENDAAMAKMMAGMTIQPSGDVDRDFAATMASHHQGAIEMAQALLRHGRNGTLRRLAQEIIVTQQQEIATMQLAVEQSPEVSRR